MSSNNFYNISKEALWILLNQFPPTYILGLENPFLGFLEEEIWTAEKKVMSELVSEELAQPLPNGNFDINDNLYSTIKKISEADAVAILQSSDDQFFIYFKEKEAIVKQPGNYGRLILTTFVSQQELINFILEKINISSKIKGCGPTLSVNINDFFDRKMNGAYYEYLIQAMDRPIANASITLIYSYGTVDSEHIHGLACLQGENGFWLLNPKEIENSDGILEIIPTNFGTFIQKLTDLLNLI